MSSVGIARYTASLRDDGKTRAKKKRPSAGEGLRKCQPANDAACLSASKPQHLLCACASMYLKSLSGAEIDSRVISRYVHTLATASAGWPRLAHWLHYLHQWQCQ